MLSIVWFGFSQKKELKGRISVGVDSHADIKSCPSFALNIVTLYGSEGRNIVGKGNFQIPHHKHEWFASNLMSASNNRLTGRIISVLNPLV